MWWIQTFGYTQLAFRFIERHEWESDKEFRLHLVLFIKITCLFHGAISLSNSQFDSFRLLIFSVFGFYCAKSLFLTLYFVSMNKSISVWNFSRFCHSIRHSSFFDGCSAVTMNPFSWVNDSATFICSMNDLTYFVIVKNTLTDWNVVDFLFVLSEEPIITCWSTTVIHFRKSCASFWVAQVFRNTFWICHKTFCQHHLVKA